MTSQEIFDLYVLQSKNVRRLKQVQDNLIRDINKDLKKGDSIQIEIKTKLLALLYCTLSEAQFIQILYTPNGFTEGEMEDIKNQKSISGKWKLMVDLAMNRVGDWQNNNDLLSRRDSIQEIIRTYIEEPQGLRNKIAHGQWVHALNSQNTKENPEITRKISELNVVKLTIWSKTHQYLAFIIRDLVQSPRIGHHNNYWIHKVALDEFILESNNWTIESRIERLNKKKHKI